MTREEQKYLKLMKKTYESTIRSCGKKHGYKMINGYVYKVIDNMIYELLVFVPPVKLGKSIKINLWCKPVALDDIYWDVFDMKEVADKEPFSFHVQGAFTADCLQLQQWEVSISGPEEMGNVLDFVFDQTEQYLEKYSSEIKTMNDFKNMISDNSYHTLNYILCEIYEHNYQKALDIINIQLANGDTGKYVCGSKGIIEYAKEYCEQRINKKQTLT
ncbi:hypothetical protein [Breznakia pachnodae]|uniref:DUF4304 domain-containing protein n=1 Tax=Breznakia pachnodae TaxID=265178 RepID=A0ABU0E5C1_9FIRM|nr:hypothetical protein [Breznakia pachnodae]MDQ0362094.1 hypothetical protein [Breznakia pachnodae]